MTNRIKVEFKLYDLEGKAIETTGGKVYVAAADDAAKQAITDIDGVALTNPRALTRGSCSFYVVDTVSAVDLYIQAPGGQFVVRKGVLASPQDIRIDTGSPNQTMVIPFSIADTTAAAETDTGFDLPLHSAVLPTPLVRVLTLDATETIDFGLLSSETNGDADGFGATVALTTAGLVKPTVLQGSNTMGALFEVQDSANAGDLTHEAHVVTGANATSITYTLTAGTDTAEGFIYLPLILAA